MILFPTTVISGVTLGHTRSMPRLARYYEGGGAGEMEGFLCALIFWMRCSVSFVLSISLASRFLVRNSMTSCSHHIHKFKT